MFNTHLSDSGHAAERKTQVQELVAAGRRYGSTLLGGDFNARPWYREMRAIWDAQYSDVDPFCRKDWDRRCNGTQVGRNSGKKFDYILHQGVNSRNCILRTVNEDHRVVISDVTRAQGPRTACSVT